MTSLRIDFETHANRQGNVEEPAAKDFCSKEGPHYCFEQSARNPLEHDQVWRVLGILSRSFLRTSNNQPWFISLEIPWGFLAQAVLRWLSRGLCNAIKCQLKDIVWEEKVWLTFPKWMFAPETFGKRQSVERKPVLSLVPGASKHLALKNSRILCPKHGGTCTRYYLGVPIEWENGTRNQIPVQPRKVQRN